MKKAIVFILSCILSVCMISTASATVVYNETTGRYYSTDEADGTLCFNGALVAATEQEICGQSSAQRYMENLIPTDAIYTSNSNSVIASVSSPTVQAFNNSRTATYVYNYTPSEDYLTLYVNGNFPSFSVEITNRQTNEVVSRGYNLLAEKYYKTAANVMGKELCVTISYESTAARSVPEIVLGSTDSPQAEFKEPSSDIMTQSVDISGSEIPKNVDGNQGKVIGSYTTVGVTSTAGHTILASKFYSTTDNMTSINLGWQSADGNYDDLGYTLNLLKGRSFKSYSIPVNYDVELRASTNSSSGSQATIRVSERAY